jgi:hypothetical protein
MNAIKYFFKRKMGDDIPKANSNELTLQYYEIWLCEGMMAALHGDFEKITEIYIPELNLTINQANSSLNVFISNYNRYNSSTKSMSGENPKLIKTDTISKKSEAAKNLIWFKDVLTKKKTIDATLTKLFE